MVVVAGIGGAYGSAAEKANPSKAKRSNSKKLSPAKKGGRKGLEVASLMKTCAASLKIRIHPKTKKMPTASFPI